MSTPSRDTDTAYNSSTSGGRGCWEARRTKIGADPAAAEPAVDATLLHTKIGALTLAPNFLALALGKTGLVPSLKR